MSLCEIGNAERHQVATIAIATVARDMESCRRVIAAARSIAETLSDAWLTDARAEVLSTAVQRTPWLGSRAVGYQAVSAK